MKKSTITDEQIFALLDEGMNNAEIHRRLGVKNISPRLKALRARHESRLPGSENIKKHIGNGKNPINLDSLPEIESPPSLQEPEPAHTAEETPPEPPADGPLRFDDIKAGDRLLRNGKPITVFSVSKKAMIIKDRFGYKAEVTREYFDGNPGKFERDPERDAINTEPTISGPEIHEVVKEEPENGKTPETIFEKVAIRNKAKRKPATINPEFEAAVQEMEQELKQKRSVEDLFEPDPAEEAIESAAPSQVVDRGDGYSKIIRAEPVHIDMEMDGGSDPVDPPRFEQEDYVDTEWFDKPIPRKGTVERVIWDRAYQEISEIQTLRATIQTALSQGKQLPTVYVDKYNRYVSKYSVEVGA